MRGIIYLLNKYFLNAVNIQALEALTDQSLPRCMLRPQTDGSSWQNHPEQWVSGLLLESWFCG